MRESNYQSLTFKFLLCVYHWDIRREMKITCVECIFFFPCQRPQNKINNSGTIVKIGFPLYCQKNILTPTHNFHKADTWTYKAFQQKMFSFQILWRCKFFNIVLKIYSKGNDPFKKLQRLLGNHLPSGHLEDQEDGIIMLRWVYGSFIKWIWGGWYHTIVSNERLYYHEC